MTRLTREASQARTRERLIEAAAQAFARSGYGGASVGDITEAAGFTKGAFYSNFDSKDAILLELLRRHRLQVVEDLSAILETGIDAEAVMQALEQHFRGTDRDAHWVMLANELQLHAARNPRFMAAYQAVHGEHCQALGRLIDALFRKARRRPPARVEDLAASFIALMSGLALQRAAGGEDVAGRMLVLFLRSLLAGAPAP